MWSFKKHIYKTEDVEGFPVVLCYDAVSLSGACSGCDVIPLANFDYMLVRFLWNYPLNGRDLDIFVGYENTGTIYDNDYVGYAQGGAIVPSSATTSNAYLWWAQDDVNPTNPDDGIESVVIGMKDFISGNTTSGDTIDITLNAVWFNTRYDGNITLELSTYTGGTMVQSGTDIINSGGTQVSITTNNINIINQSSSGNVINSQHLGTLTYNKLTNTGVVNLI